MPKALTKMIDLVRHRLWAELADDSRLRSLRFATIGWVPRKRERMRGIQDRHAVSVLREGASGSYWHEPKGEVRPVRGPGVFFVSPGVRRDYGPEKDPEIWDEFYWIVEGERVAEWARLGWWPTESRFWPVERACADEAWRIFGASRQAIERRDARALDRAKLALERWLSEGVWTEGAGPGPGAASPLAKVVEDWRREPVRAWSIAECARGAGMSYSRFRARFRTEHGRSPYAYLLHLRLELARGWLRSTDEPVKAVAARCGFAGAERFIRAFANEHGATPARWRAEQAALALRAAAEATATTTEKLSPRARSASRQR